MIENVLLSIFFAIQAITAFYLLIPFFSLAAHTALKLFGIKNPEERKKIVIDKNFEFGIIITAHQETDFAVALLDSILKQSYGNFQAYLVADDCDISHLHFNDDRVHILRPADPLHSKIRSIQYAIERFPGSHDALVILDSDSLLHPKYLEVMNDYFRKGYRVVQGDFKPKNTDTNFARMDAMGDMVNFYLDREIRQKLGMSASIWGSGVAIDVALYKQIRYSDHLGGFDKKMQADLVLAVPRMAFARKAIVYDEKIESGDSLEKQRTRWISAYFKYFSESWKVFATGVKRLSLNLMYFGFVLLRPPLFLVFAAAGLFMVIDFFISIPAFITWLVIFALFILSFIGIVLVRSRDARYIGTIFQLPLFVFRQVFAFLNMGKAKKSFMKTQHTRLLYIDDILNVK